LLCGQARRTNRIIGQELVELGHELLELPEREERTVFSPCWACDVVASFAHEDFSRRDNRLPRERGLEAHDSGVRNPIEVAEIC
jgi:hypothetical protein